MILTILRLPSPIFTALKLRSELALENLALRQQLVSLNRPYRRPRLWRSDRAFCLLLSRCWSHWKETLAIVKPKTVVRWHRKRFTLYWTRLSQKGRPGWSAEDHENREQSPYVERLIGSIRPECLGHVVVLSEESLRRILRSYVSYYHNSRCHQALDKDSPVTREVQPPDMGVVVEIPRVGGLHHRYVRRAA